MTPLERLTCVLYLLLRDEVPVGTLERILVDHVDVAMRVGHPVYSSGPLRLVAEDLARRILHD